MVSWLVREDILPEVLTVIDQTKVKFVMALCIGFFPFRVVSWFLNLIVNVRECSNGFPEWAERHAEPTTSNTAIFNLNDLLSLFVLTKLI